MIEGLTSFIIHIIMRNIFLSTLVLVLVAGCQSGETDQAKLTTGDQIVIGQIDSLHSEILNETRKIWIYLPASAKKKEADLRKYPVLFLLDGDGHFRSVTGMIYQLSTVNGNTILPETVVVGISNTDRTRDLTPSHVDVAFGDSTFVKTSGGGEHFLDFLEKELIPYVEDQYPVSGYRTFVGHSFGGLTVVYSLLTRPELFNNYIAIDPSLWWDDQLLLKMADTLLPVTTFKNRSLFIGVANTMAEGMELSNVDKDTTEQTEHIRSILRFVSLVDSNKESNGLDVGWKYYSEDDHGSVPLITEYDAIRFLFPWYRMRELDQFFSPESEATPEEIVNVITTHYQNVSSRLGYNMNPPEALINTLGYAFMSSNMPEKAYAMFQLNIENYPGSANVWDSMGDYFLSRADTAKAIENFSRAVEINGFPVSKEKLEKLVQK